MLDIKTNIPLAPYTIYKIGGPASFFAEVKTAEELKEALLFAQEKGLPFFILGAGSNVLISDQGVAGLVIHKSGGEVKINGDRVVVDAGVMMAKAVLVSAKAGLTGFEWGVGVPGTIGGSVRGNAGCFGGEMGQVVERVQLLEFSIFNFQFSNKLQPPSSKFQIRELDSKDCQFGYRDSIFKKHPEWIILSATLKLKKGDLLEIQKEVKRIVTERGQKQDIGTKTCGCIFKNVEWAKIGVDKEKLVRDFSELAAFIDKPNIPSSFLIDRTGLKGKKIGRVFISPKHANFFVNEGGASAEEVRKLIGFAKAEVEKKYGLRLEEEIIYVEF